MISKTAYEYKQWIRGNIDPDGTVNMDSVEGKHNPIQLYDGPAIAPKKSRLLRNLGLAGLGLGALGGAGYLGYRAFNNDEDIDDDM